MDIHQLLPGLHPGDAISYQALALKRLLRSWGHSSEIYANDISLEVKEECRHFSDYPPRPEDLVIYHYSIGSDQLTELFLQSPGKRLLIYHNITPHPFLEPYNADLTLACKVGRQALRELAGAADMALADSPYNCRELAEHGFRNPRVLPLLLDFRQWDATAPASEILNRFADDWTHFLFVGRLSPNKRQDDVIRVFAQYNRRIEPRSRLLLVGSWRYLENYLQELQDLASSLGVLDHVFFLGHVRQDELGAYYRLADIFLCMSEHEGFCVPLLEAMHHHLPVLAYAAAAVPDTLGRAGILVGRKDHAAIAELAHLMITDQDLRDRVVRGQAQRLADFRPEPIVHEFRSTIAELIQA